MNDGENVRRDMMTVLVLYDIGRLMGGRMGVVRYMSTPAYVFSQSLRSAKACISDVRCLVIFFEGMLQPPGAENTVEEAMQLRIRFSFVGGQCFGGGGGCLLVRDGEESGDDGGREAG